MVSLHLENITVSFPGRGRVLDDVSFSVEDGSIACILGPTGCGKTTTLRVISGITRPVAGGISFDGARLEGSHPMSVGCVFQEPRLLPWRSVLDNVVFALEPHELDSHKRRSRGIELLALVGLGGREDEKPENLSGGEKQRVSLARALAPDPNLILADEPFNSLDVPTRRRIVDQFARIIEKTGKTSIFVTHDLFEALYLADRLIVYSPCPARVVADIQVKDKRPRDLSRQQMIELRERVVKLLEA
jgi:NitT/TauT family transport system ATP-binding protein